MTTVHVHYFALLREQRGLSEETFTTASATVAALYEELRARHQFTLPASRLRVALNGEFAPWSSPLMQDMKIAFIPPVAGG